jgi:hypothetical protein
MPFCSNSSNLALVSRLLLFTAVDLDLMTRTRHVQSPIPRTPHIHRLQIETVVLAPDTQLQPPLRIDWQVNSPGAPRIFVLLREVLRGHVVPDIAAVRRDLNTFRPACRCRSFFRGQQPGLDVVASPLPPDLTGACRA